MTGSGSRLVPDGVPDTSNHENHENTYTHPLRGRTGQRGWPQFPVSPIYENQPQPALADGTALAVPRQADGVKNGGTETDDLFCLHVEWGRADGPRVSGAVQDRFDSDELSIQ